VDGSGNVYVTDTGNNRIQKFTSAGRFLTKWGSAGTGDGQFQDPTDVMVDKAGNVYVVDSKNNRIQKFDANGNFISKWGRKGSGDGEFDGPNGLAIDREGDILVSDTGNGRIQKFGPDGRFLSKWGSRGTEDGQLNAPQGLAVDGAGNIYVADPGRPQNYIQKFASDGRFLTRWDKTKDPVRGHLHHPMDVAVDAAGDIWVADEWDFAVLKSTPDGECLSRWSPWQGRYFSDGRGLEVQTVKGTDVCFAAYRAGMYKVGGLETDAVQAFVQMDGSKVQAMYLAGGQTLKAAGATIERSEPGLAYVERLADGTYMVGNPSPSSATVTVTLPGVTEAMPFRVQFEGGGEAVLATKGR